MGASEINGVLRRLCRPALLDVSDHDLVAALLNRRDQIAFEALLRRHGPMVLAVCRRVLGNTHDAEDAFQSTFLVLIRKASAIRKSEAVGSWLYGVAYLTARKARQMNARRQTAETIAAALQRPRFADQATGLDDEINALPEKYRVPVVLCELEGQSRKDVARKLNIPEGTLSSRLATARIMLAKRLRRRGWDLSDFSPAPSILPGGPISMTCKAAVRMLEGQGIAEAASGAVAALSNEVVRTMFTSKLKVMAAVAVALGVVGVGTTEYARLAAQGPAKPDGKQATPVDPVRQAADDLAAANAALKQAEAKLAAARAEVAHKEASYGDARRVSSGAEKSKRDAGALFVGSRFKYRVPAELGDSESKEGGRIDILDVWGTRPRIEVGGEYLVHGKWALPSCSRGTLYFWMSSQYVLVKWPPPDPSASSAHAKELAKLITNDSDPQVAGIAARLLAFSQVPPGSANLDLQSTDVQRGEGEFTLLHAMHAPGYFHLQLKAQDGERYVTAADVYFGTGHNVWRRKK